MKSIIALSFLLVSLCGAFAQRPDDFFEDSNEFFQTYVTAGLINYDSINQDHTLLNRLVNEIAGFLVVGKEPVVQKAFYTNAYNILVIKQIIDNYPTKGPMEVKGFFTKSKFNVAGQQVTLDELEKDILFAAFPDARLHFVLVCAAVGCPPISDYAYVPDSLETLIDRKTHEVLNINWYVRVYKEKTLISKVFDWYQADFLGDTTNIKSYINKYRELQIPEAHALDSYEYDWSLNDSKNIRY